MRKPSRAFLVPYADLVASSSTPQALPTLPAPWHAGGFNVGSPGLAVTSTTLLLVRYNLVYGHR
jgi:hypothetical protein